jgi:hypothetical protein
MSSLVPLAFAYVWWIEKFFIAGSIIEPVVQLE